MMGFASLYPSYALIHATEFIDTLPFKGDRMMESQSLSWPRRGVFRDDGVPVLGIPEEIKETTCLVAGFILATVLFDIPAMGWVMLKIGHLLKEDTNLGDHQAAWH